VTRTERPASRSPAARSFHARHGGSPGALRTALPISGTAARGGTVLELG